MPNKKNSSLSSLLRTDGSAYNFYSQLPYNVQEEVINHKDEIHTIVDLQKCVDKVIRYE